MKSSHLKTRLNELHELARQIRKTKAEYKQAQRDGKPCWRPLQAYQQARYAFRHLHIAVCLVRGTERGKIERVRRRCQRVEPCYCCNLPDELAIASLVQQIRSAIAQEIHDEAALRVGQE